MKMVGKRLFEGGSYGPPSLGGLIFFSVFVGKIIETKSQLMLFPISIPISRAASHQLGKAVAILRPSLLPSLVTATASALKRGSTVLNMGSAEKRNCTELRAM